MLGGGPGINTGEMMDSRGGGFGGSASSVSVLIINFVHWQEYLL